MGRTTLVLGGARSGKSEVAEAVVAAIGGPVTYVATGGSPDQSLDADWAARVAAHRARRPAAWTTVEATGDLVDLLGLLSGVVLLESLGTWVASSPAFVADVDGLVNALVEREGDTVVVSEEVGLGVHPETDVGRAFRDALGTANRSIAEIADDAWLVVAGRRLRLDRP